MQLLEKGICLLKLGKKFFSLSTECLLLDLTDV